ncbi:MAG: hypothetical protein SGARI_001688, partial [Bacillariaceae sp.]
MAPNKKKSSSKKKEKAAAAPKQPQMPLEEGTFVEIHSLQPALNGRKGTIVRYDPSIEQFCVKLLVPPPQNFVRSSSNNGAWTYDPVLKTIKAQNLKGTCLHGSNPDNFFLAGGYQDVLIRDFFDPVRENGLHDALGYFFKKHEDGLAESQPFCDHVFSAAEDFLGRNALKACQAALMVALSIKYTTIPLSKGEPVGLGSDNNETKMRYMGRLENKRNLIRCLSSHLPCRCYRGEVRAAAKKLENLFWCVNCNGTFSLNQLQYCSKCRARRYCSEA